MRNLNELLNKHAGEDIYVVGTGASMRVFPTGFFEDKITIGLNLAWQLMHVKYAITMVPHLNFPEFLGEDVPERTVWITKRDKYIIHASNDMIKYADANYYYFRTDGRLSVNELNEPSEAGRVLEWVAKPNADFLYLWTSISQTAVNLASNMGAKNIFLVGCDNCALLDNHHAHGQHTLWKGVDPAVRYNQYYLGLREVRGALNHRNINLLTINPFLKLDTPEIDFKYLCEIQEKSTYLRNDDIYQEVPLLQHNKRFLLMTKVILMKNIKAMWNVLKGLLNGK
jgi:hypothetical protein